MWLFQVFAELLVLAAAVWIGCQFAGIEFADFNRCFSVAVFALVFSVVIKLGMFFLATALSAPLIYALT